MSSRTWWVAPVVGAAVTGGVFAAIAVPGLAGGATVPDRLVVHRSPAAQAPQATPTPSSRPAAATSSPSAAPTTQVVVPDRPVVRESNDRNDAKSERSTDSKYGDSGGRGG